MVRRRELSQQAQKVCDFLLAHTLCVDINPATVIKLTDRGTAQALGIVSDVGVFIPILAEELKKLKKRA